MTDEGILQKIREILNNRDARNSGPLEGDELEMFATISDAQSFQEIRRLFRREGILESVQRVLNKREAQSDSLGQGHPSEWDATIRDAEAFQKIKELFLRLERKEESG